MGNIWTIVIGVLGAGLGCLLSERVIPAGTPRLIAEIGSVLAGLAVMVGGRVLR